MTDSKKAKDRPKPARAFLPMSTVSTMTKTLTAVAMNARIVKKNSLAANQTTSKEAYRHKPEEVEKHCHDLWQSRFTGNQIMDCRVCMDSLTAKRVMIPGMHQVVSNAWKSENFSRQIAKQQQRMASATRITPRLVIRIMGNPEALAHFEDQDGIFDFVDQLDELESSIMERILDGKPDERGLTKSITDFIKEKPVIAKKLQKRVKLTDSKRT
jgi:hypothetical protein